MASTSGSVVVDLTLKNTITAGPFAYDPFGNHPTWTTDFPIPIIQQIANSYTNGSGANQVSRVYSGQFTSSTALSVVIGNLLSTDQFIGLSSIRTLMIVNTDTNPAHVLRFGNDGIGTNLFLGGLTGTGVYREIRPGAAYLDQVPLGTSGYAVSGANGNLRFDPQGVTITWKILVLGS